MLKAKDPSHKGLSKREIVTLCLASVLLFITANIYTTRAIIRDGKYMGRVALVQEGRLIIAKIVHVYSDMDGYILVLAPTGKYYSVTVGDVLPIDIF